MLPQEIMFDILTRLPAKSVGRFRCVSKPWRFLLSEPGFLKTHLNRTKQVLSNQRLLLICIGFGTLYSVNIAHHLFDEITAYATNLNVVLHPEFLSEGIPTCDGLILIRDAADNRLLVNPTTKDVRYLPDSQYGLDPNACFSMYGLGYDHVSDDYKLVKISFYDTDNEHEPGCTEMFVNVYSVRSGVWKKVESSPYDHAVSHIIAGVFVSGRIHWIASRTSGYSSVIVGFDLAEEKFREVPAPSSVDGESFVFHRLEVIGGCLCIFPSSPVKETVVWVMKEYGVKESWTKFTIVVKELAEFRPLLCSLGQREMVMLKDEDTLDEKIVMHNFDNGTFEDIAVQGFTDEFLVGRTFVETLVSPYYKFTILRPEQNESASRCGSI